MNMRRKTSVILLLILLAASGCTTGASEDVSQTEKQAEISDKKTAATSSEQIIETEAENETQSTEIIQGGMESYKLLANFSCEATIKNVQKRDGYYYAEADVAAPVLINSVEIDSLETGNAYKFPDVMMYENDGNGNLTINSRDGIELEYVLDDGQYKYFTDLGTDFGTFSIENQWDDVENIYRLAKYDDGYLLEIKYMNTMPGEFYPQLSYEQGVTLKIDLSAEMLYYDTAKGFPEYQKYDECSFDEFFTNNLTSCWNEQMGLDNWRGLYSFVAIKTDANGVVTEIADGFPAG